MKFEYRKQLEMLSVKAFGKPHAYNKLYKRGYPAEMTEKLEDGTERKYKGVKYQTLAEIETVMHELIVKKKQEEAEKKVKEAQLVPEGKSNETGT